MDPIAGPSKRKNSADGSDEFLYIIGHYKMKNDQDPNTKPHSHFSFNQTIKNSSEVRSRKKALVIAQYIVENYRQIHCKWATFKAVGLLPNYITDLKTKEDVVKFLAPHLQQSVEAGVQWNPSNDYDPRHLTLFKKCYADFVIYQEKLLFQDVPHADPDFIRTMADDPLGYCVQIFIDQALEGSITYPLRSDYINRLDFADANAHLLYTAKDFLNHYDNPLQEFMENSPPNDDLYKEEALLQLKTDFRCTNFLHIKEVFKSNGFQYTRTHRQLQEERSLPIIPGNIKKRQATECLRKMLTHAFLLREVALARKKDDIEKHFKDQETARTLAEKTQNRITCVICCDEKIELDFVACPEGHQICCDCVRKRADDLIGSMQIHIPCIPALDCGCEYSLEILKKAIGKRIYRRLEKQRQMEEILSAGVEGLKSCPFCDYCEVPPDDELFRCKNPECAKFSCQKCRKIFHSPLTCQEEEHQKSIKDYVERKKSEALIRECPKCHCRFVRSDGCNQMKCGMCGTVICYICRKAIGTDHFYDLLPIEGKCPTWTNNEKVHSEDLAKAEEAALTYLAVANPVVRLDLLLNKNRSAEK